MTRFECEEWVQQRGRKDDLYYSINQSYEVRSFMMEENWLVGFSSEKVLFFWCAGGGGVLATPLI